MAKQPSLLGPKQIAAGIERAKAVTYGWYWGTLTLDEAADLLQEEPDGSFIVRDSCNSQYMFSLAIKLIGRVFHFRIDYDYGQGIFSWDSLVRPHFDKAYTIVEFVEHMVANSRSGTYNFVFEQTRAQLLLHPYSRFRHPRFLQHMCRIVILKYVRRDQLNTLPLPKSLQDYLNSTKTEDDE